MTGVQTCALPISFFLYQVENDARIEVAATATHRKAIERSEAHGRRHAFAPVHRAHAGAAAEVGDSYAAIGGFRTKDIRKDAGDVLYLHLSQPNDDVFVDSEEDEDDEIEAEAEANAFAKDSLVPRDTWLRSEARRFGNAASVVELAKQLGIHPAIVAGRIRYESRKFWMFQDLIGMGQVREAIYSS